MIQGTTWFSVVIGVWPPRLTFPYQGGRNAGTEFLLLGGLSLSNSSHSTVLASQVAWITGESTLHAAWALGRRVSEYSVFIIQSILGTVSWCMCAILGLFTPEIKAATIDLTFSWLSAQIWLSSRERSAWLRAVRKENAKYISVILKKFVPSSENDLSKQFRQENLVL